MTKQILIVGSSASADIADVLMSKAHMDARPAISIGRFDSGEPFVEFFPKDLNNHATNADLLKDAHVVILQSTGVPVSDNCQHILQMAHTAKLYGAAKVTAVMPYKSFDRQDRPFDQRFTSMTSDLFPKLLKAAGVDAVITLTPHSQDSIKHYVETFGPEFSALSTRDLFANDIRKHLGTDIQTMSIGAPDGANKPKDEGQARAHDLVRAVFNTVASDPNAMFRISKIHTDTSKTKITSFDGDVTGKDCAIVDDMIDGGSTMLNAAQELKDRGAKSVTCYATHPVLSGNALEKIMAKQNNGVDVIDRLVVTDTIPDVTHKLEELAKNNAALAAHVRILCAGKLIAQELNRKAGYAPQQKSTPKRAP